MSRTATKSRTPRTARTARKSAPSVLQTGALYAAYGSNLNRDQMQWRCPDAVPLGTVWVPDTRLVFRGVADIEPCEGATVPVGLWRITPACERELDIYEGYRPGNRGLYRKEYIPMEVTGPEGAKVEQALVYVMNSNRYGMPSRGYYDCIARGYADFGIPLAPLVEAQEFTRDMLRNAA